MDRLGCESLPGGRFVTGVAETSIGRIRAVGVCIPWRDAHVRSGRRDRRPWENHAAYLDGLGRVLTHFRRETGVVLLGDFNQRVPRHRNPVAVFDALLAATTGYEWATAGDFPELGGAVIDHIVHSPDLTSLGRQGIPAERANDTPLSDHPGVVVTLAPSPNPLIQDALPHLPRKR